ncbi:glycoside hydrolase family 88 protein [Clostridium sp. HBUAS56017]|uniref:glycoside hydrolase family 88/105 protein n=1 Tax=Clostridium sp. HBUAS56017 TaxID=2571128 RepID=UPI001178C120|nr:glycoside hydrolase family 88 protein [Clostridium sp. HBUAS56017]
MKITEKEILSKLDLVVDKLLNLDRPSDEKKLTEEGGEAIGMFPRDFGIQEWDWPQGVGLYGLLKLNKYYKNNKYLDFLNNWYKNNLKVGLPSKNINTTAPLLTLVDLCDLVDNPEYEKLCLTWADWLMNCLPRTKEGAFQHVTSANGDRQGVRLNESEMWIDTLFMTVLFLNRMGQKYQRQDWIDESINQVLVHIKYLYDKKSGLFYHGWSFNENSNFGEVFWCRGNSWFTFGILDYIEMFDGTLNPGIKKFLVDTFIAQVKALVKYQSKSGLWNTVIDDSTSYEEVSGSAAIVTGILRGIKLGILDDKYKAPAEKAIIAICKNIAKDGTVLNVSGGTGMGYNKDHYKNIIIAPMAYGQSLTICALTEVLNHL